MFKPSLLTLFAQTPVPISVEWQGGLISLLLFSLVVLSIWEKLRRKPPVEEFVDKKIQAQSDQTDRKIDALDRRRELGEKEIRQLVSDHVSQMEKFISKQITDNRENSTDKFSALFTKIDATNATMQALSGDVMLHIGRIEGQLTEVSKKVA